MTIFLTTQYLEEADVLADRVGIIDGGRIVAEGTPSELKRSVGADLIIVQVAGAASPVIAALDRVAGVIGVEAHGSEAVISTENGSSVISAVVVALSERDISVRELTLRTPTLDDVFLELTGNRIADDDNDNDDKGTTDKGTTDNREQVK